MKYIIAKDVYMFQDEGQMYSIEVASKRKLLLHLLDITDATLIDEDDPERGTHATVSEEALEKWFTDANGDGQPYVRVFSVEEDKQVLG